MVINSYAAAVNKRGQVVWAAVYGRDGPVEVTLAEQRVSEEPVSSQHRRDSVYSGAQGGRMENCQR